VVLEVLGNLPASLVIPIAARLPQSHFVEFLLRDAGLLRDWLAATEIDQALMFVGRMSRHQAIALIEGVENPKLARRLMRAIRYPEHCVGAVMSVKLRRIDSNLTLEQMLTDLRASRDPGSLPAVVLDESGRYLGKLDPWKVLLRGASVEKSADCLQKVEPLLPEMTIISARQAPQWEQHHWLPVADQKGRILGAVSRSALDEAETTPDELLIEGLAGAGSMLIRVFAALMERLLVRKLAP
jgi:Mg/Co/Ni transporter MgtE